MQRPSNLLKCYQLNLSRKTLQTNFWHGNGLPRFYCDRQPNHRKCWKKSPVDIPLATKNLDTLCTVDDTFVIIHKNSVEDFLDHLNTIENSIKLTIEKEADHTLPFLDTLVRRNQHGKFSTSVYRKPTNSNRYLNFRSDHPLEHKQSVVRSLIDRANALCSTTKNRQDEIKHVKDTLKLNLYPNTTLIKKPSNRTEQQFKGFAIIPYYPGLTEKIWCCLSNHNVKTVLKPCNTIGKKLARHKDSVDPDMRQGAVYQIPCHDCDFSYIGETKRSFSIRKKEHY